MAYNVVITRRQSGSERMNLLHPYRIRVLSTGHNGDPAQQRVRRHDAVRYAKMLLETMDLVE